MGIGGLRKINKTKFYFAVQRYIFNLTASKVNLSCESKYNYLSNIYINTNEQTEGKADQYQTLNSFLCHFYLIQSILHSLVLF